MVQICENESFTPDDPHGLTSRSDIGHSLDYTCLCGWVDWGHANAWTVTPLKRGPIWGDGYGSLKRGQGVARSLSQPGYLVRARQYQTLGIMEDDVWGYYFVQDGLSLPERESVALGIWMEISERFEQHQASLPSSIATKSGFSGEDLVSDLLAFYMAVRGISVKTMKRYCRAVPPDESRLIWDRIYVKTGKGIGDFKNHRWEPLDFNLQSCSCGLTMDWPPKELQPLIKPAPKGQWWRDWKKSLDGGLDIRDNDEWNVNEPGDVIVGPYRGHNGPLQYPVGSAYR